MSNDLLALAEDCRFRAHAAEIMRHGNREVGNLPEFLREVAAALEAAQGVPEQQPPSTFPPRIWNLLQVVADRKGTDFNAPWEDENGEPMQDDADSAIAWIRAAQGVPAVESSKNDLDNAYLAGRIDENKEWNDRLSATVELPPEVIITMKLGGDDVTFSPEWRGDYVVFKRDAFSQWLARKSDPVELPVVAQIIRNEAGQIRICDANGDAFDMSKYVGARLCAQAAIGEKHPDEFSCPYCFDGTQSYSVPWIELPERVPPTDTGKVIIGQRPQLKPAEMDRDAELIQHALINRKPQ